MGHWSFPQALRLFLTIAVAAMSLAHAQSVRWEPASGTLAHNQFSELNLVFEQCEPTGTLTLPSVPGLAFGTPNRSESNSFTIINGNASRTRTVTLAYRVRPTVRASLTIPAFSVDTDQGRQRVAAATFEVGDVTVGQTERTTDEIARSRFTLPSRSVWAGEVFPLTYTLNASKSRLYNLNKDFEWDPAPLSIEPWSNPQQVDAVLNNEQRVSIIYNTRAFVQAPGDYALHPATQLVNITTGASPFGMFSRARLEQIPVSSPRVDLTVKPLPSPAPATFKNAVGQFTLDSKVVPATATVGEPVTWTLTLEGTGNWPDIPGLPSRSVSKEFTPITPQAKRVNKEGALFDATLTEDVILIPTKPGRYTLGPVTYTFFNPKTGAYETLTTPAVTLQITPGATASASSASSSPSNSGGSSDDPSANRPQASAPSPSPIPRDPLPPAAPALSPVSRSTLLAALLSSALLPLIAWLVFACRRARLTDPARPQREARIRLANTLKTGGTTSVSSAAVTAALQSWQRDTAILWSLPQAVPTPASFDSSMGHPSLGMGHSNGSAAWSGLWAEADRTLYGGAPLPSDWTSRATQALAEHHTPAFSVFQLFRLRNLFPVVALICFLMGGRTSVSAAESAAEPPQAHPSAASSAYAAGDFSTAATAWSDTLKTAPTDWVAHHNLALALIQQNRPGEAAGHAAAAFVQQPQNPSVRWHLDYAFKSAGVSPRALAPFLNKSPLGSLARLASPARWQLALIIAAWLAAVALTLTIWAAYEKPAQGTTAPAPRHSPFVIRYWSFRAALGAASVLLGVTASLSLHTYGVLANARAVIVATPTTLRSIPTDLDTQKTSPLALGVVAITDKSFLGWRCVIFPDGQTGWVRAETVIPLWKP